MVTVSGRKFFVVVVGTTNNTHDPIVEKIRKMGGVPVDSVANCDFILVFCPVASRVGTDILEALQKLDST